MVARNNMLVSLFAFAAWGQTSDKVFYFTHLETPQAMQEVSNAVRSIGDIRDVSLDAAERSLTVKGTADQIAIAGWLTAELDKSGTVPGTRDFPFNDARTPLAQIVYLSHVDNPRDLQEIVNSVRSVTDIQRCFPMNLQKAIVMRGSPAQVKAADWLLGELDQATGPQTGGSPHEYRLLAADWVTSSRDLVLQVAAVTHLETPQALQEATNLIRGMADIQRCFPVYPRMVLVIRGSDDQISLANWLLKQLDGPGGQGTQEFNVGGPSNQVAQVAYVNTATPQSLLETVNEIRSRAKMQRVFPFNPQRAVALRGTADQVSLAQQVIQSRNGH
jgi:hypothetical protein